MRAQVTIFVILGLVILIVIGFGLFLQNSIGKQNLETQAENTAQAITEDQSITFFVQSCLESVSNEGVRLLGLQGGVIYEDQGGLTPRSETPIYWTDQGTPYEVALGIKKSEEPTPEYPLVEGSVTNQEAPIFGSNVMRKLCDYNGPNAPYITNGSIQTCKIFTSYNYLDNTTITVQEELEHYIETTISSCVDLTTFEVVYERDITTGEPNAEVIMTENAFVTLLDYPLTISYQNESVTSQVTYTHESTLPLQEVYNYLFNLADQETRIWNHTIINDSTNATYYQEGLQASWKPVVETQEANYQVLQVLDTKNLIDNKPLRYQVVVENRRPVIDYFNKTPEEWHHVNYSTSHSDNKILELKPLIFDPDDETPILTYKGWKETCELVYVKDSLSTLIDFGIAMNGGVDEDDVGDLKNLQVCNEDIIPDPKLSSGKEIVVLPGDLGLHLINITVTDARNNELVDWQDVYVLVSPTA